MSDPLISVLIPCYNRVDTLEQCVMSAVNSGYDNLQIIISDNGSSDGTGDLARRLAQQDKRIELIIHSANKGPLPNWKSCLDRAQGTLIHWLWSDDWVEPSFYRDLVTAMQKNDAQMALCAARIHFEGKSDSQILYQLGDTAHSGRDMARKMTQGRGPIAPVSPACALLPAHICREAFTELIPVSFGIDCNKRAIGCDAAMMITCAWNSHAVISLDAPLAVFRAHSGSISVSSAGWFLSGHYAWARLWLAKKLGLPWTWGNYDRLRLFRFRIRHVTKKIFG